MSSAEEITLDQRIEIEKIQFGEIGLGPILGAITSSPDNLSGEIETQFQIGSLKAGYFSIDFHFSDFIPRLQTLIQIICKGTLKLGEDKNVNWNIQLKATENQLSGLSEFQFQWGDTWSLVSPLSNISIDSALQNLESHLQLKTQSDTWTIPERVDWKWEKIENTSQISFSWADELSHENLIMGEVDLAWILEHDKNSLINDASHSNVSININDFEVPDIISAESLDISVQLNPLLLGTLVDLPFGSFPEVIPALLNCIPESRPSSQLSFAMKEIYFSNVPVYIEGLRLQLLDNKRCRVECDGVHWNFENLGNLTLNIIGSDKNSFLINSEFISDTNTIQINEMQCMMAFSNESLESIILDIPSLKWFQNESSLVSTFIPLPIIESVTGKNSLKGFLHFNRTQNWNPYGHISCHFHHDFVTFEEIDLELKNVNWTYQRDWNPRTQETFSGTISAQSIEMGNITSHDFESVFETRESGNPFLTLNNWNLFGGSVESSPIFLGNLPDKVAFHLNAHKLDAHQITSLIDDFQGEMHAQLNGQLSGIYQENGFRFQYGHFYLNNPSSATFQWNTSGLITGNNSGKGFTYNKLKELEEAIGDLYLQVVNVFISNRKLDESLMKVEINGIPKDKTIKNPVHLKLRLLGNWQSLMDYILNGSENQLQFSIE